MNTIIVVLFVAQLLGAAAMFGIALRDARSYRTPFGKLFLPYKTQVIVCLWLMASLLANIIALAAR